MLSLRLPLDESSSPNILCLGAHPDDIEIGCGGTILRFAKEFPKCTFNWVVFSGGGVRTAEARRAASLFAGTNVRNGPVLKDFNDGFMPFSGAQVKEVFEELKVSISPDLILTHYRGDAHQDHRLLADLTWNTFRDHLILEYEIPKYDGDIGQPTFFVPLDFELCEAKIDYLMEAFPSQKEKRWFRKETFFSLMRLRGMECNAPSGYAEAFYCRKVPV
jgi:LmbE family N-acetylglucosaminyl deacetylase